MSYVNADEVLPEDLIREIQKYVDGKVLYIPRRSEKAIGWGEKNGAKNRLAKRNKEIVKRKQYEKGYYKTHPCNETFVCKNCGRTVGIS